MVAWVDHAYVRDAVRPQRTQDFDMVVPLIGEVETLLDNGELYENSLKTDIAIDRHWIERTPLPPGLAFASFRLSVNYFTGTTQ